MVKKHSSKKVRSYKRGKQNRVSRNRRTLSGGEVIGVGSYGCVFSPPLPCKGEERLSSEFVSKLMETKSAEEEMDEINKIKKIVDKIPNNSKYFAISDTRICSLGGLTESDIKGKYCNIIRLKLLIRDVDKGYDLDDEVKLLQQKNAGISFGDYIAEGNIKNIQQMKRLFDNMNDLLMKGIIPMNKLGLYHEDIKSDNVMVKDDQPRLIDWGLAVTEFGLVNDASARGAVFEPGTKPPMTSYFMFNAPLSLPYFYQPGWQGDEAGAVQPFFKMTKDKNKPINDEQNLLKRLLTFENEGHFQYLRSILKQAMSILKNNNVPSVPNSSQTVFRDYLMKQNNAYVNSEMTINHDKLYKNTYLNIDKWGWAMTFAPIMSRLKSQNWMNKQQKDNIELAVAQLIYYLFTGGAIILDADKMVDIVNSAMPDISSKSVIKVKRRKLKTPKEVSSKPKIRPVGTRKASQFTPTGKLPTGMMKGLTKTKKLTKAHESYIKSLGKTSSKNKASTKKNKKIIPVEIKRLSPIIEAPESPSPLNNASQPSS